MNTILTIITVGKDGIRRNINTSVVVSDLESYRQEILSSNSELEKVFFVYEKKVE